MSDKILSDESKWTDEPSLTDNASFSCCNLKCNKSYVRCWRFKYGNGSEDYFYKERCNDGDWLKIRWLCDEHYEEYLKLRAKEKGEPIDCDYEMVLTAQQAQELTERISSEMMDIMKTIREFAGHGYYECEILERKISPESRSRLLKLGYALKSHGGGTDIVSWAKQEW